MAEGWDWLDIFRDDYGHEYGNDGGNMTGVIDVKEQIAYDEILAEELQELENLLIDSSSHEFTDMAYMGSSSMTGEDATHDYEEEVTRQDQVDPDNMTYEELQSLEENVGNESRGLSDEVISTLPSSKYKSGFFSKKRDHTKYVSILSL
ncbi:uncharacterized protein [Typha angustifolia]|uniref:uncharacterized protein n=1 Tax=Typha angustifolia TaxID=59011 RepID=UPI003C2F9958